MRGPDNSEERLIEAITGYDAGAGKLERITTKDALAAECRRGNGIEASDFELKAVVLVNSLKTDTVKVEVGRAAVRNRRRGSAGTEGSRTIAYLCGGSIVEHVYIGKLRYDGIRLAQTFKSVAERNATGDADCKRRRGDQ